jgi:hypothetical protein
MSSFELSNLISGFNWKSPLLIVAEIVFAKTVFPFAAPRASTLSLLSKYSAL